MAETPILEKIAKRSQTTNRRIAARLNNAPLWMTVRGIIDHRDFCVAEVKNKREPHEIRIGVTWNRLGRRPAFPLAREKQLWFVLPEVLSDLVLKNEEALKKEIDE